VTARILDDGMRASRGQPVVVEIVAVPRAVLGPAASRVRLQMAIRSASATSSRCPTRCRTAGAIKAYAVMAKERLSAAPDVPTVDKAGLPGPYMSPGRRFCVPKGHRSDRN
jgi:tripartite-type tricarboxylate transporter receptor subunit TctC